VEADPPQTVWLDGEFYKNTPVTIQVHPGAVKIVVP
jgi:diacylglycerol kinase family enzyme